MQYFARKITSRLIQDNIITPKMSAIYQYGFELFFSTVFTSVSILIVSCIMDSLYMGLLYFAITIPLRITAGGYHASTYRKCFLISNLLYIALSCIAKILFLPEFPCIVWISLLLISALYIGQKAPVKNIHHPVGRKVLSKNKKICSILLLLNCSVLLPLIIFMPQSGMVQFAVLCIVSVALLIIPTQFHEQDG